MRSLLKTSRTAAVLSMGALVLASGCSAAAATSVQESAGTLDDIPMVAISAELQECLPGVGNMLDPFWAPEPEQAATNGYGFVDSIIDSESLSGTSIDCEPVMERVTQVAMTNAQVSAGKAAIEANEAWAACMKSQGFDEVSDLQNRKGTLFDKTDFPDGVVGWDAYIEMIEPVKEFEISMAVADSECFASEILTRTESIAAEQEAILAELPADQLELLRGA